LHKTSCLARVEKPYKPWLGWTMFALEFIAIHKPKESWTETMKINKVSKKSNAAKEQLELRERCLLEYQSRVEVLPIVRDIVAEYSQSLLDLQDSDDHLRRRLDGYQRRTDASYYDEFDMLILSAVAYYAVAQSSMKAAEEYSGSQKVTVEVERILPIVEQLSGRKRELAREFAVRCRYLLALYGEEAEEQE
jgi:hypothetical protein